MMNLPRKIYKTVNFIDRKEKGMVYYPKLDSTLIF